MKSVITEHKREDMNYPEYKCKEEGCEIRALFGTEVPLYCFRHKGEKMRFFCSNKRENVNYPEYKCKEEGCEITALFGTEIPLYCFTHKREGMRIWN